MKERFLAASAKEHNTSHFRELLARNQLPKQPIILEKKRVKNFKPPSGGKMGSLDQSSVTKQVI